MEYAHIQEENASVENIINDEDITFVGTEKCLEPKGKGKLKEVMPQEELETPRCPSPANPDQHFDPATYEARHFYVADNSGSKRRVPDSDIIRWSKVPKPDGTTSVESNAQFVKLSDGSLQLSIGDAASDAPEGSLNPPVNVLLEMAEEPKDILEAGTPTGKATHEHEHGGKEIEGSIPVVEEQEMEESQENEPHDSSK